jgi:hypothetical protein
MLQFCLSWQSSRTFSVVVIVVVQTSVTGSSGIPVTIVKDKKLELILAIHFQLFFY